MSISRQTRVAFERSRRNERLSGVRKEARVNRARIHEAATLEVSN